MVPSLKPHRYRRCVLQSWMLLGALIAASSTRTQAEAPSAPEPIYWRQNLLTVPYQWSSSTGRAAKSVMLFVSKDRGASWQPISDAQPQLLAFNYRAEADGEYWFSIRTTDADSRGAASAPAGAGAMQPELRVIVDTTMPRIESLSGQLRGDGSLDARSRATDPNLGAHSCSVEVQLEGATNWQPVPLTGASEVSPDTWEGVATYAASTSAPPSAVRATVTDLAGNRAVFQSTVAAVAPGDLSTRSVPRPLPPVTAAGPGWVSNSAPSPPLPVEPVGPQIWPADRLARAPFDATPESNQRTVYGAPLEVAAAQPTTIDAPADRLEIPEPQTEDRPLGNVPPPRDPELEPSRPFRQISMSHARVQTESAPRSVEADLPPLPSNPLARLVNSRTFALEYELAEVGADGVAKVELWGTRDGGQSWRYYATDDDNRSPFDVTVDDEGEYGFSIVVSGAGGPRSSPPKPGDTPALWVNVDRQAPIAQILSVNATRGDTEGELTVRWEADDDNLEPRPIALYYSSRPAGPWTTIATELENSGEFRWPLQRHVPRKIYLKLEARDTAGNVAAFQTSEPLVVEHEPAVANWLRLPPVE